MIYNNSGASIPKLRVDNETINYVRASLYLDNCCAEKEVSGIIITDTTIKKVSKENA